MEFLNNNLNQIVGVLVVAIVLSGRKVILPSVKSKPWLMWVAFLVTVGCGLILGWALIGVMLWVTGLGGITGLAIGAIGAIAAVWLGWISVEMLVAGIRDLADRVPDEDARKAALWVPTLLPAGGSAVFGIVSNPQGIGTGITAAILAGLTIVYGHKVVTAALKSKNHRNAWRWFAAAVSLLIGVVMVPLILYVDGWLSSMLSARWMLALRILASAAGLALLIAALKDIADKVPDQWVRRFLAYGAPTLFAFGALLVTFLSSGVSNGAELLTGVAA